VRAELESTQRGVALLVTLLAVALLTVTVMQFTYASQVDYRRTAHWLQARKAALLADGGIELGREVLTLSRLLYAAQNLKDKKADSLTELWATLCSRPGPSTCPTSAAPVCSIDAADGRLAVRIEDETGLFNLNRLAGVVQAQAGREFALLERILLAASDDPTLAGPIIDWIDPNTQMFPFAPGAELGQYTELDLPYGPRDRPFETFRELALVRGMDAAALARLRPFVTAHRLRGKNNEIIQTININTAPIELLAALDPQMPLLVAQIHDQRCQKPFESIEDLRKRVPEIPTWLGADWLHFESDLFRIRSTGSVDDVYQSVEALVRREGPSYRIVYYLPRRGPNIEGVDMSAATSLNDLNFGNPGLGGRL